MRTFDPIRDLGNRVAVVRTALEFGFRARVLRASRSDLGTWLASRFRDLGPTYVKIGQFVSSRADLFGDDFAGPMAALRNSAAPVDPRVTKGMISTFVARRPGRIANVDPTPLASASVGQTHLALTTAGQQILVKFKRPNAAERISSDLEFLRWVVRVASSSSRAAETEAAVRAIDELEEYLTLETDFRTELSNAQTFRALYGADGRFRIPRVYADLSDDDAIAMEYVRDVMPPGSTLADYAGDRPRLAGDLMSFFVRQLITHGVLHGDPHLANLGLAEDGRIVLYDYGSVIDVSRDDRYLLKELVGMIALGNKYGVADNLERLGATVSDGAAVLDYVERYIRYMKTIDASAFEGLRDPGAGFRMSGKLMRILRVFGILEGTCKRLDRDFNYFKLAESSGAAGILMDDDGFLAHKAAKDVMTLYRRALGGVPPPAPLPGSKAWSDRI